MNHSLALIGKTPMFQIPGTSIFAKLEKYNLGGSIKDRAVLGMVQAAQAEGKVKEDTILVEATSGNTGIAVALIASILGLKAVIIMPESMSVERRQLVKAYGAQLILTPKELGMKGAIAKQEEILEKYDNTLALSQFTNPANPGVHYETTAQEILEQVPEVDIFVAGVGTGGTFTGVSRYLKEHRKGVLAVAVEPSASPVISEGKAGVHMIQGIGAGFVPDNFDASLMDTIETVSNEEALEEGKAFIRTTGIGIGISGGAALVVAKRQAAKYPDKNVVVILPDGAEKYLSMYEFDEVTYVAE